MSLPLRTRSTERTVASRAVTLIEQHGTEAPHRCGFWSGDSWDMSSPDQACLHLQPLSYAQTDSCSSISSSILSGLKVDPIGREAPTSATQPAGLATTFGCSCVRARLHCPFQHFTAREMIAVLFFGCNRPFLSLLIIFGASTYRGIHSFPT